MTVVTGEIFLDASPLPRKLPVLVSGGGPLLPLLKYQIQHLKQQLSWHERLNFCVRLLLEYAEANPDLCNDPEHLFTCFVNRLKLGTVDSDGVDSSMLYWMPRTNREVRQIISFITDFSRYLSKFYGAKELNREREATFGERVMRTAAFRHRSDANFLQHLDSPYDAWDRSGTIDNITDVGPDPTIYSDGHINFPEEDFSCLLFKGFEVNPLAADPHDRWNLKDVLITLLLWGGGIRTSEAFHLWFEDVTVHPSDPTVAWVRIGHPKRQKRLWMENGALKTGTRAEYLRSIGYLPRDDERGRMRAGWKNPALDRKYELEVHWSDQEYGRLFLFLWRKYLDRIRHLNPPHPWAWVVEQGRTAGNPFSIADYRADFTAALERIGLKADASKGHNPHGLRHAYAVRLKERKLKPKIIQRCLHHASIKSQTVYTEQEYVEMNNALTEGRDKAEAVSIETAVNMLTDFEKILLKS